MASTSGQRFRQGAANPCWHRRWSLPWFAVFFLAGEGDIQGMAADSSQMMP